MTFNEAVEEMKKLAGSNAWSFHYVVASYFDGVQIHGYIQRDGSSHAEPANTYRGAIDNVKFMISPIPDSPPPQEGE
jgi:hypothetical protein